MYPQNWRSLIKPKALQVDRETLTDRYGKFVCAPLERGYGVTLGNALRRVLLASIQGAAVYAVRIEGVNHEFTSLEGMKEDVSELILNIKELRFKLLKGESATVTVDVSGSRTVLADDLKADEETIRVLNPTHKLATLAENGTLRMDLLVRMDKGYIPADRQDATLVPKGFMPIDSIHTPIEKVTFDVSDARVERITDYNKLTMEIWTDGSINPDDALGVAAKILKEQLQPFITFREEDESAQAQPMSPAEAKLMELLNKPVIELEFSVRSSNCLKAAGIGSVGQLIARSEGEMLQTKNFGKKSLNEIKEILASMNLRLGMNVDELVNEARRKDRLAGQTSAFDD